MTEMSQRKQNPGSMRWCILISQYPRTCESNRKQWTDQFPSMSSGERRFSAWKIAWRVKNLVTTLGGILALLLLSPRPVYFSFCERKATSTTRCFDVYVHNAHDCCALPFDKNWHWAVSSTIYSWGGVSFFLTWNSNASLKFSLISASHLPCYFLKEYTA